MTRCCVGAVVILAQEYYSSQHSNMLVPREQPKLIYRTASVVRGKRERPKAEVWREYHVLAKARAAMLVAHRSAAGAVHTDLEFTKTTIRKQRGRQPVHKRRILKLTPVRGKLKGRRVDMRVALPAQSGWGRKTVAIRVFGWQHAMQGRAKTH